MVLLAGHKLCVCESFFASFLSLTFPLTSFKYTFLQTHTHIQRKKAFPELFRREEHKKGGKRHKQLESLKIEWPSRARCRFPLSFVFFSMHITNTQRESTAKMKRFVMAYRAFGIARQMTNSNTTLFVSHEASR